ncbi:MAG: glycosyltransferase, partial [Actinobacteria bacterium]|nr:glycosyltransferase [Actinomycetota bacterium]
MLLNIITITKDDIEGLKKTIESTRKLRENHDVEQIIVDGSRNDLRQEIEKSLTGEKNISCFWQKPSGRSSAFNYGIKVAKADWVWFLNGGDEVYSGLDAGNFLYLLSNNGSDAIIFQIENMQSKLMPKHPQMWALWPPLLSWIPHPSTLTRRELYDKYGYYNELFE